MNNAGALAFDRDLPLAGPSPAAAWLAPWAATQAYRRGLTFLRRLQTGKSPDVRRRSLTLACPGGLAFGADEYQPLSAPSGPLPTILLMHGLSPAAHHDPRMVGLARALATAGFRVVAPELPEVRALEITPVTIDNIARCIRTVALDDASRHHRVGVFSASFTGGLSVLAAGRPEAAHWVSGVCAIGSYTDVTSTLQFLMSADHADPYGRCVILKNFLRYSIGCDTEVQAALDVALTDNLHPERPADLPVFLQRARPRTVNLLTALLGDAATRRYHFERMRPHLRARCLQLDVIKNVAGLRCPVWLLHGEDDAVIPATQSRLLHVSLRQAGHRSMLVVSPLLGHSHVSLGAGAAAHVWQLLGAVAAYFKAIAAPAR